MTATSAGIAAIKRRIAEGRDPKFAQTQYISQYVTDLRQITGYYLPWIPETSHDVEDFYDCIENDAAVKHAMHLLSLMVAGEYFEVSGPDKMWNQIAVKAFRHIIRFTHSRKSMISKSVLYGLAIQKKEWKKVTWDEFPGMSWEVPTRIKEVDRRRVRIERGFEDKNDLCYTIWCPKTDQYMKLEDRNINPVALNAVQDYLWVMHEFEEMSPYGRGIGEVLYPLIYIKRQVVQYWADLAEHWGQPMLVATIQAARAAVDAALKGGTGVKNASDIMDNWLDMLEKMRARHVAVKPDYDKLDIHEAGSTGQNILKELIDYIDKKIELLILGAELTTMAPSVGSYALGQLHKGATQSIVSYNRSNIEEVFERDLLYDFYLRNRYNFLALGLYWIAPCPVKFKIKVEKEEQQEEMMQAGQEMPDMANMGIM